MEVARTLLDEEGPHTLFCGGTTRLDCLVTNLEQPIYVHMPMYIYTMNIHVMNDNGFVGEMYCVLHLSNDLLLLVVREESRHHS